MVSLVLSGVFELTSRVVDCKIVSVYEISDGYEFVASALHRAENKRKGLGDMFAVVMT